MGLDNLLYYILNLIVEGHKWQYQNATCTNTSPKLYYTTLQWVAIGLASIFVLTKTSGLNNDIVDYLLSSLSIMTGFFLALVVVVYEIFDRKVRTIREASIREQLPVIGIIPDFKE